MNRETSANEDRRILMTGMANNQERFIEAKDMSISVDEVDT